MNIPLNETFQAIRIECNRELEVLKDSLEELIRIAESVEEGYVLITFHSLEDRIVKTAFKQAAKSSLPSCHHSFPVCVCGKVSKGKVVKTANRFYQVKMS